MIKRISRKIEIFGRMIFKEIGIFFGLTIVWYLLLLAVIYSTADIDKRIPFSQEEKMALTVIIPIISGAFSIASRLLYKYKILPERQREKEKRAVEEMKLLGIRVKISSQTLLNDSLKGLGER